MQVSKLLKIVIWFLWILIVPAGIWLTHLYFPSQISGDHWIFVQFAILVCLLAYFPLVINQTPIFSAQAVSLTVFLVYGLSTELILMQIAVLALMLKVKVTKQDSFRIPLNSLMFFLVSLTSGLIYYAIGGTHFALDINNKEDFLKILAYATTYFVINQTILSLIIIYLFKRKRNIFGKDLLVDSISSIIAFPIGLVLFTLYQQLGSIAILFVGIPMLGLSLILRLYYSSENINRFLQKASEVGHQLAERLNVDEVLDVFINQISEIFHVDVAYILDVDQQKQELYMLRSINGRKEKFRPLKPFEGISGTVWKTEQSVLYCKQKEWKHLSMGTLPDYIESVLAVPILRNSEVRGVLLLGSRQQRAYEKSQLMIVDILCSYLAIAVENAKHHQIAKQKSERCALTGLYNFGYFETKLSQLFMDNNEAQEKKISIILIDIDHFKSVNDNYGHQSGNDILCQIAKRINEYVGDRGLVARYGGEEFVIMVENYSCSEVYKMAEEIRKLIATRPFTVTSDLETTRSKILVNITASIGFATAPKDADDAMSLMRHADRAMYTGAKRAGRNKVAQYIK
ncbi:sensor domain-containing diguanylate cyclase [Peribacillus acanthi]|uniref:sensor domain-containing diguanylate cyclase n=1 Tax=Peribacillus acanthi TaxID=2171554 RepID=UPI000D3E95EE|nr:sensor domain-containing diguanylate cyclase [Peribacillus acanthi]